MLLCANIDDESDGVFFFFSFLLFDPAPPFPFADVVDVTGPGARDGPFIYIYTDVRAPLSPFFLRPLSLDLDLISRPCYLGCSIVPLPPPLDGSLFSCTIPTSITKNDGASRGGKKKTRVEVSSSVQRFI